MIKFIKAVSKFRVKNLQPKAGDYFLKLLLMGYKPEELPELWEEEDG